MLKTNLLCVCSNVLYNRLQMDDDVVDILEILNDRLLMSTCWIENTGMAYDIDSYAHVQEARTTEVQTNVLWWVRTTGAMLDPSYTSFQAWWLLPKGLSLPDAMANASHLDQTPAQIRVWINRQHLQAYVALLGKIRLRDNIDHSMVYELVAHQVEGTSDNSLVVFFLIHAKDIVSIA